MSGKDFSVNAVVSSLLRDYLAVPDYSAKKAEVEAHQFVTLKLCAEECGRWFRIQFVTSDTAVVQSILMRFDETRFCVKQIPLAEWDSKFVEWIDADHHRFYDVEDSWFAGLQEYGADV